MAEEQTTQTPPAVEEPPRQNLTPSPQELMQRGMAERAAEQPPEENPWAVLGEGAEEIAQKKGWKSPADMLKAYEAATTRLSQRDEEKESLMEELARYEQGAPAPQQQQAPVQQQGQVSPLDFDALAASLIDPNTGEMNHGRMMEVAVSLGARMAFDAAEARMEERLNQFRQEHVGPLAERDAQAQMAAEMQEIAQAYGPELYGELERRIEERLTEDKTFLDQFRGLQGAFAHVMFEYQRDQAAEAAAGAEAHTIRGGARRPQAPTLTPEQQELAAMESHRWKPNDGFSLHSRLRWG